MIYHINNSTNTIIKYLKKESLALHARVKRVSQRRPLHGPGEIPFRMIYLRVIHGIETDEVEDEDEDEDEQEDKKTN